MLVGHIENATRVLGRDQGYIGLPVRGELLTDGVARESLACMVAAWFPTQEELARLIVGAPIHIRLIGKQHPPIMVNVGNVPE